MPRRPNAPAPPVPPVRTNSGPSLKRPPQAAPSVNPPRTARPPSAAITPKPARPHRPTPSQPQPRTSRQVSQPSPQTLIRRVVEPVAPLPPVRVVRRDRLAWARALIAGVQAALLTYVLVVVPAVAAFTATSAKTVNLGRSWFDAVRQATALFLAGHGGSLTLGAGAEAVLVTVPPLGIALLGLLACRLLGRLAGSGSWWLLGCGSVGYAGTVAALGYICGTPAARITAPTAIGGAAIIAILGLTWGDTKHQASQAIADWGHQRLPLGLASVPRVAAAAVLMLLGAAAVIVLAWAVGGYSAFGTVFNGLDPDTIGGIALAGLCLAFAPNLVIWSSAYLTGVGFSIGQETVFSPLQVTAGPMPALPTLAFLPTTAPALASLVIALPVAVGAGIGWWLRRRLPHENRWWTMLLLALVAAALVAVTLAALISLAGGGVGHDRLATVGASPWRVGALAFVELAGAAVPVAVFGRAVVADRLWKAAHPSRPISVTGRARRTNQPEDRPAPPRNPTTAPEPKSEQGC